MPFGPVFAPSLGLSLLKAELTAAGIPSRIRYFTIAFAECIGERLYSGIAEGDRPQLVALAGEWMFSRALFGTSDADEAAYADAILRPNGTSDSHLQRLLRARREVDRFLDACVHEIAEQRPAVVGFTSVFQQHVASLALARRLKQLLPDTFILFGGANCEGVMGAETLRQFPFVDAVVSGEGDLVVPELVGRILAGRSIAGLAGVRTRDRLNEEFAFGRFPNGPMVTRLDELPSPDYGDYFDQFAKSRFEDGWQPAVFFESSRGCWWGERMHCTFCGLNGSTMTYRSKSAARVVDELAQLAAAHPDSDILVVDNILDMDYFKTVLPQLAERRLDLKLFYETKSNLKKEQVRLLRAGGVRQIQPGIESFSNGVLKLMRKGVSALQNIQLLKWCAELGVEPVWNLLWGFPGEPQDEYARMAALVPLLSHLPPPGAAGPLRLDRFSPNFTQADALGFTDVQPLAPYRHVYPLPAAAVANLAYYFSFTYRTPQDVPRYVAALERNVRAWKRSTGRSGLFAIDLEDTLTIWDLRPGVRVVLTVLNGLDRALYRACDAACDATQLVESVRPSLGGRSLAPAEVGERLAPLVARGLIVQDGARYLALAIPLGDYRLPDALLTRFYQIVRRLGRSRAGAIVVPLSPGGRHRARATRSRPRRTRPRTLARPRSIRRPRAGRLPRFSLNEQGDLVVRNS